MKRLCIVLSVVMGISTSGWASQSGGGGYNFPEAEGAGPYSSSQACFNPTAPDRCIAGFVGPHDEGAARLKSGDGGFINASNYVNPIFKAWASSVVSYLPSDETGTYTMDGIGEQFADPTKTLGTVTGDNFHIVSLGDRDATEIAADKAPGVLTLGVAEPIGNGSGADFAVFENGFISAGGAGVAGQIFAELTYCEVSSDGEYFARFPANSLTPDLVGPYGTIDPTNVCNLVGKHVNAYGSSWGTPFDLDELANDPFVQDGSVDLNEINYIRLIDIAGDGSQLDSENRPIYDAWVTWGSGGADIEAIGVIRHFGEEQMASAGDGVLGWNWNSKDGAVRLEYSGLTAETSFNAMPWSSSDAVALLADVDDLNGTEYQWLNGWQIDATNAAFSVDGGITLFGYFDPRLSQTPEDIILLRWVDDHWENNGIESIDTDNFLLKSPLLSGSPSSIFAVVAVYLLPGDANGDHRVDVGDLGILAANYGTVTGATWEMGDFNGDEAVDVADLGMLAANYGAGTSGTAHFQADYANAFDKLCMDDAPSQEQANSTSCLGLGLPLIVGLAAMGLMLTRLET